MLSVSLASSLRQCQIAIVAQGPGKLSVRHGMPAYDFAGTITPLGANVLTFCRFAVGDRLSGMVHGTIKLKPNVGALAVYVGSTVDIVLNLSDSISFEEVICLAFKVATAEIALYIRRTHVP